MSYLIVIVVLFGLMWALLIRPQRKRSQVQMLNAGLAVQRLLG